MVVAVLAAADADRRAGTEGFRLLEVCARIAHLECCGPGRIAARGDEKKSGDSSISSGERRARGVRGRIAARGNEKSEVFLVIFGDRDYMPLLSDMLAIFKWTLQ